MILISCRTSQKFQAQTGEDKALFKAINELNRKPDNAKAQSDLIVFYPQAKQYHEEMIAGYNNSNDINRYDKILVQLNALQHIYNSIMATPGTASLLKPKSYVKEIEAVREEGAEVYYRQGLDFAALEGRSNNLNAYKAFHKSNDFIAGYKDVTGLMKDAYQKSIVHIVINPIEDRNIYFTNWSANDYTYRPEEYQQLLVNELSGAASNGFPARFYTDRELRRTGLRPDWAVDIQWVNIDPIQSTPHTYSREVSREIQIGSDTSGKPVYKNVKAILQVTERNYGMRGDLEYRVNDLVENRSIDYGRLNDDVSWTERYATYRGDSRALSQQDWALINNQNGYNRNPSRSEVMNSLMRKMYPDLRRRIQYSLK
ncbi:MAG TPA: hypothetical protein VM012_00560 [Flavitalea sp.]|nr:hypothetical protein [Flavitalea sp.]